MIIADGISTFYKSSDKKTTTSSQKTEKMSFSELIGVLKQVQ